MKDENYNISSFDNIPEGYKNGMEIYDLFAQSDLDLDNFKYNRDYDKTSKKSKNSALGIPNTTPNKSNRVDSKRRDYLANVSLPPTINATPQPGVRVENNSILIGGIN
jgi:hypothetical protein